MATEPKLGGSTFKCTIVLAQVDDGGRTHPIRMDRKASALEAKYARIALAGELECPVVPAGVDGEVIYASGAVEKEFLKLLVRVDDDPLERSRAERDRHTGLVC